MAEPIVVSYSEIDSYRQCPLKHALSYKARWTKKQDADSPLARGTLWHNVMEAHYQVIQAHGKVLASDEATVLATCRTAIDVVLAAQPAEAAESVTLVTWMYDGYVARYGADRDWEILQIEAKWVEPLRDTRGHKTRYHMKMKVDLVIRDRYNGQIWIVDHKSAKDLLRKSELDLDDQFGLYTWGARQRGMQVMGSIHSGARTQRNKGPMVLEDRFSRTPMFRSDKELSVVAQDALLAAKASRRPEPPYSSPNPNQCAWKCDFKEVHLAMRKGIPAVDALTDRGFVQDFTRH